MHSILEIKSFCLPVCIGNTLEERKTPQEIQIDIKIGFLKPPSSEKNDNLKDVFCYKAVCERINCLTANKHFFLIEKLAGDILSELKKCCSNEFRIQVCVHKIQAPVQNLKGGVSYTCGDLF